MDLNHRPHPYQGCALTELSYGPWICAGILKRRGDPAISARGLLEIGDLRLRVLPAVEVVRLGMARSVQLVDADSSVLAVRVDETVVPVHRPHVPVGRHRVRVFLRGSRIAEVDRVEPTGV